MPNVNNRISLNNVTAPFLDYGFKKAAYLNVISEIDPSISDFDLMMAWDHGIISADVLRKIDAVVEILKSE